MDNGIPQLMDIDILKKYIQEGGIALNTAQDINKLKQLTSQATGNCSWRAENIVHKKNEVYIDIVENINVLMSQKGNILRADVAGAVQVKALLSGMPECKFGMNDKLLMAKE